MVALKNILVATDFSEPSAVAIAYGRDLARAYGATLHVLHVVEDINCGSALRSGFLGGMQTDFEKRAGGTRRGHHRRGPPALEGDARRGNPRECGRTRTAPAKTNAIDLIIVGTHGRGAIKKFLMGSVAERVVRTAPCPVLAVREHERDSLRPTR